MFPVLLPKGIVVNSSDIYSEVASYRTVPPEKISEYWHVYTTTFRKLIDPTAHRLEHFWWHVWGSDRRFLSGAVLARLFEDISRGPTVVELLGPPGRFEGPVQRPAASQNLNSRPPANRPSHVRGVQGGGRGKASHPADPPLKPLSSSSSKPPPSHPILKKSRGPSSSGPRPTARFISPHESSEENDDDDHQKETGSKAPRDGEGRPRQTKAPVCSENPSTIAAEIRPTAQSPAAPKVERNMNTPSGPKKTPTTRPAWKKSPQSARRTGTQSQAGSGEGGIPAARDGSSRQGDANRVNSQRPIDLIVGNASGQVSTQSSSQAASKTENAPVLSAKAAGKRPAIPRHLSDSKSRLQGQTLLHHRLPQISQYIPEPSRGLVSVPGAQLSSLEFKRQAHPPGFEAVIARNQSARDLAQRRFEPVGAQPMVRSRSDMESRDDGSGATGRHPVKGLISGTAAVTSSVAAQGTFEFDQASIPPPTEQNRWEEEEDDHDRYPHPRRPSSFLESRLTPTAPNPSPDVPLGRTKSQLTLLLERDKTRLGQS